MFKFDVGVHVRDTINGFNGIITSRTEFLNGCIRYGVHPRELKDGKSIDGESIDEQQLELVNDGIKLQPKQDADPVIRKGGPPSRKISKTPQR